MARALLLLVALGAAAAVAAADTITNRTVLDQSVFPTERPPMWNFRTAANASYTCKKFTSTPGWTLTLKHAPVTGVTRNMMLWMYQNLATGSAASPIDGKTYPLFLLYHPRDHVRHTTTKMPAVAVPNANATWIEFPLTGCVRKGAAFDWDCPSGPATPNPGYLRSTPVEQWAFQEQTNGTSRISELSNAAVSFATHGCNNQGCADVIITRHSWTQTAAARKKAPVAQPPTPKLLVTTVLTVGINMKDNDQHIVNAWANGLDPETKCHRAARHYIEEIGGTENWLPQAFAATGLKP